MRFPEACRWPWSNLVSRRIPLPSRGVSFAAPGPHRRAVGGRPRPVGRCLPASPDSGAHVHAPGPLHTARPGRGPRAVRAAPGRVVGSASGPVRRRHLGPPASDRDRAPGLRSGDGRGRQRRLLQRSRRPPRRDRDAEPRPAVGSQLGAFEHRDRAQRDPRHPPRGLERLLAGTRPAPAADRPQRAREPGRDHALHTGLGSRHSTCRRRHRGGHLSLPGANARERPEWQRRPVHPGR